MPQSEHCCQESSKQTANLISAHEKESCHLTLNVIKHFNFFFLYSLCKLAKFLAVPGISIVKANE